MPIRINLLAEDLAQEDLRRRDPVKRAAVAGLCLIIAMLAWSSSLQLKSMLAKGGLSRVEGDLGARTNAFQQALEKQRRLADVNYKLVCLQQLATNRLLYGTLLNALQETTIDEVQLVRFHAEQSYQVTEGTKPKTNSASHIVAGKAARSTEKIVLTLDAKDSGNNPGDQVNRFKQAVTENNYFQSALGKTNEVRLASLSPPQASVESKPFVTFTLECRFPERTR